MPSGKARLQSNFSPRTLKHHGKRGSTRDQRARRINNLANPAKSAKPPSPVQIRAAPPNSLRNSRDWVGACVRGRFSIAPKSPQIAPRCRRATSVKHSIATSCQRAISAGKEVRGTSTSSTPRVADLSRLPRDGVQGCRRCRCVYATKRVGRPRRDDPQGAGQPGGQHPSAGTSSHPGPIDRSTSDGRIKAVRFRLGSLAFAHACQQRRELRLASHARVVRRSLGRRRTSPSIFPSAFTAPST